MISGIMALIAVVCAQIIVYVMPTLIVARRLANNSSWVIVGWLALFLGVCSQAISGLIWGHLVRHNPALEASIWLIGWLIATLICLTRKSPQTSLCLEIRLEFKDGLLIGAIITAGLLLRSIHPLQHWGLGQSDAYSHLQFMQEVLANGYNSNLLYPPGQAWVTGLPAIIFHLDPYVMARYGGLFFGLCLILAVYTLVKVNSRGLAPALIAIFLVSLFPAFNILHKTSIGVFANQLGLFLIPSLLTLYLLWRKDSFQLNPLSIYFSVGVAAMIATTPVMLIHILILVALDQLTWGLIDGRNMVRSIPRIALILVPAALLIALHAGHANPRAIEAAIHIVTPSAESGVSSTSESSLTGKSSITQPHPHKLKSNNAFRDFASIKRYGFHNWRLNLGGATIFVLFMISLVHGWRERSSLYILVGLWGGLTSIQALTGWLQFSMYQREGWSLIIATIVLAGLVGGILWNRLVRGTVVRSGIILTLIASAGVAFLNPPGHAFFASSAEDDIVLWIKLISEYYQPLGLWPPVASRDPHQQRIMDTFPTHGIPVLITRQMAGWSSGQGELIHVIGQGMPTMTFDLNPDKKPKLDHRRHYIFLIETPQPAGTQSPSVSFFTRSIQPEMANNFANVRDNEWLYVRAMEAFIAETSTQQWSVWRAQLSPHLSAAILTPSTK